MTETPTPIPDIVIKKYGVKWKLRRGYAVDEEGNRLSRTEEGFPIVEGEDDVTEEYISYFHTDYRWKSVELNYNYVTPGGTKPLKRYRVNGSVFGYIETIKNEGTDDETRTIQTFDDEYIVTSLDIISEDPNPGNTWIFPDDYNVEVAPGHPTQYGGVILFTEQTPAEKEAGDTFECGIDDGKDDDGKVYWGGTFTISGYNYIDVFDQADFAYVPRNSNTDVEISHNERFRFEPLYPSLEDPKGLKAPLYPMNMITRFLPDERDSVTVTYRVSMTATDKEGEPIFLENPNITIKQTCTQDTSDYSEQLKQLLSYCNWSNPQDIDLDDFSPTYPQDYPYTLVSGFDGVDLNNEPRYRGNDRDNESLRRGDVWYDPKTDQRKYYSISDIPDELKVKEQGSGYRDKKNVPCVWIMPKDENGKPVRCFNSNNVEDVPKGLLVDIDTKDGKIIKANLSNDGDPSGFKDGDFVSVSTGNGDAVLKVVISSRPRWVSQYIRRY